MTAKDVGTGTVRAETVAAVEESLKLHLSSSGTNAANLVVHWDKTRVVIPIVLNP